MKLTNGNEELQKKILVLQNELNAANAMKTRIGLLEDQLQALQAHNPAEMSVCVATLTYAFRMPVC